MMDHIRYETCQRFFNFLNLYSTQILTSKFYIIECISRTIKVIDYHNARWKPEINCLTPFILRRWRILCAACENVWIKYGGVSVKQIVLGWVCVGII
jgi:hypothetical protein